MANNFRKTVLGFYTTVSEQLQQARKKMQLSLEDCAEATSIQKKYLVALEQSHFEILPGEIYTRAWIKKYAEFLGVNTNDLMISYEKERSVRNKIQTTKEEPSRSIAVWFGEHFTLRRATIALVIIGMLSYVGLLAYKTISPPQVTLNLPDQGFRTQENSIILKGQTEAGALIHVNTETIALDAGNAFEQEIILHDGLNTVTIDAYKKYSRGYHREIHVVKTSLPNLQQQTGY